MEVLQRLYLWFCRRWGPDGLTFSAYAWKHAMETGDHSLRIRIDGLFMLLVKQQGHCSSQFKRESRN